MIPLDPVELARKRRRHRNERIFATIFVIIAAIAAAAVVRWNQQEKAALRANQHYIPKPVTMTPELTMLQELVRIDSSNPAGVAAAARWSADYLRANGIQAEIIQSTPAAHNVYARIRGRQRGNALLLFSHLDVVPPGPGWTQAPFQASLFGDRLYGRGTIDMKALIVCQLAAFVDQAKSREQPEHDLVFLATADEETGSQHGMQWLLANRPDLFEGVAYGLTEGGLTEMTGEKMTYFGIEIGGKQLVKVVVEAQSLDDLRQARIALEPWMFSRTAEHVLPEVRMYLQQLAPTRMAFRTHLEDIDATIRSGRFWQLPPTYRNLLQNSITTIAPRKAGDHWEMDVLMLNLPNERPAERIEWLERLVRPHGGHIGSVITSEGPVAFSSHRTAIFDILTREARERYAAAAGVQILYRSTTDCRFLRARGITCYGISPYPITYYQSMTIHHQNEFITVGSFQQGVEYLRAVVREWAKQG